MDLDELRAFLAVIEHGSLLAAAEATGVARTTLNRRVASLEARVGRELFHRTAWGTVPTDLGSAFADRGRTLLSEASKLLAEAATDSPELSRALRMAVPIGFPSPASAVLLGRLRSAMPTLDVVFQQHTDPGSLVPFEADLALTLGAPRDDSAVVGLVFHRSTVRLAATPQYLERHGTPRSFAELADHALIAWDTPRRPGSELPLLTGGTVPVTPRFRCNNGETIRNMLATGEFLACGPVNPAGEPQVVFVLEDLVGEEVPVWMLIPRAMHGTRRVREAIDVLRGVQRAAPVSGMCDLPEPGES